MPVETITEGRIRVEQRESDGRKSSETKILKGTGEVSGRTECERWQKNKEMSQKVSGRRDQLQRMQQKELDISSF